MLNTLTHLQQSEFCRLGCFFFCGAVVVLKIGDLFSKCFWLEKVYTEQTTLSESIHYSSCPTSPLQSLFVLRSFQIHHYET